MAIEKEEKRDRDKGHKQEKKGEIKLLHVFPIFLGLCWYGVWL